MERKSDLFCSCSTFFFPFRLLKRRARKRTEKAPNAATATSFLVPELRLTCSKRQRDGGRERERESVRHGGAEKEEDATPTPTCTRVSHLWKGGKDGQRKVRRTQDGRL